MAHFLVEHPQWQQRLRSEPSLLPPAIEQIRS